MLAGRGGVGEDEGQLRLGNGLSILGPMFLVPAMVGVVCVISDLLFGGEIVAAL